MKTKFISPQVYLIPTWPKHHILTGSVENATLEKFDGVDDYFEN